VLPNVSVWLATMVCGPSASPLGVNDHAPCALAVAVAATGLPSIVKCTTVLARPGSRSAHHWRDVISGRRPGVERQALVTVGPVVLSV